MKDKTYSFTVTVDVSGKSLAEAYGKLHRRMNANDWESTDDVYDSEDHVVTLREFEAARAEYFESAEHPGSLEHIRQLTADDPYKEPATLFDAAQRVETRKT
jgi:hypothetical protein